ncbi:hypothetical protein [Haloarchaeobius sp. TZWSO28]|uniref:hypothetical protein n=1 Tax=unclassified Haloarchaeobius TaxID=2614452 RepID=UPI003EB8F387
MFDTITTLYVSAVTVLFFFWVYGIYAFVRDCRRTLAPKARQLVQGWQLMRTDDAQQDRADNEPRLH